MSHSAPTNQPQMCCPNPTCAAPLNALGNSVCAACQTPLIYRYLWAVGTVEHIPTGTQIAGRYYVTAPKIWLDTQPSLLPNRPQEWSDEIIPYLSLYSYRLHLPQLYGSCLKDESGIGDVFLLENVPLDAVGYLYPTIAQVWSQVPSVRQVYWLWQMLQLWTPLLEQGVASSLLSANNIRVDGWRIRLCQLYRDADVLPILGTTSAPTKAPQPNSGVGLADLANLWSGWVDNAHPTIVEPLRSLCQQMHSAEIEVKSIAAQLNQLLLEQAAQLPLRLHIAGGTDQGPQRSHNEDTCYPITVNAASAPEGPAQLAIVCDGIGGHEGGEVASQTAVRSLKLQIQALLAEMAEQTEVISPDLVVEQLEAIVRVVNNLIATQNDKQGREDRRRMGTTLMMALQLPQRIQTPDGTTFDNAHELYLVHVGDSRAYWMTPYYCQQLTVDDDVATREVKFGRSLYREALRRSDAGSLTQAVGTRSGEFLQPTVQRFILEEDGLLLLCSDGLSDNNLVEQFWMEYTTESVFTHSHSLEATVKHWIDLANQKNGHDNTSVVIMRCQVASPRPVAEPETVVESDQPGSEWSEASRSLTEDLEPAQPQVAEPVTVRRSRPLITLLVLVALFTLGGAIGLAVWSQLDPAQFQQFREKVLPGMSSQPPDASARS